MSLKTSLKKIGVIVAATGGAYLIHQNINTNKRIAYASWTTNHVPSVKWDWNWDSRDPKVMIKPPKKGEICDDNNNNIVKSKASRHLILIRHGQYNLDGETDTERTLTTLGREQAALTGERLKALSLPITRFTYSTMTRATETAQIILSKLDELPVEKCDMLREGAPIPPEPPTGAWKPEAYFYVDGARIEAAFRKYFHRASTSQTEDSYEVIVCHANVIRYFVCRALQLPPEAWLRIGLQNGSMTRLVIRPDGRVSVTHLGDTGYMPPHVMTST